MNDYATPFAAGEIRLERTLPGPIDRIWAYLTEPGKRAKWFAGGPIELRAGGRAELHFDHQSLTPDNETPPAKHAACASPFKSYGRVTQCAPPRLLSYSWGEESGAQSEVTFELTPQGSNVLLVLTHRRLKNLEAEVGVSAGWHMHAGILEATLAGRRPDPLWSTLARLEAEYEQRLRRVTVRLARRFSAPPEHIFDAWLDPSRLAQWMFGPRLRDEQVVRLSVDPRIGGAFSFVVRRDGKEIDHVGTYRALDRPRRLAFTWGIAGESDGDSVVTIDIAPFDGGSELTLTHDLDPKWADYAARTESSWTKMLGALESVRQVSGLPLLEPDDFCHGS